MEYPGTRRIALPRAWDRVQLALLQGLDRSARDHPPVGQDAYTAKGETISLPVDRDKDHLLRIGPRCSREVWVGTQHHIEISALSADNKI